MERRQFLQSTVLGAAATMPATAADIGDGPVRRLAGQRLQMLMQKAEAAKRELKAFNNREHSTRRAVAYRDF